MTYDDIFVNTVLFWGVCVGKGVCVAKSEVGRGRHLTWFKDNLDKEVLTQTTDYF